MELDRLDRDGTAEMLTHLLGVEPEPGTVDTINERAQGNPFFIEQFAASGDECGDIPDNLRDLLLSRVDQLPEPAQRVLRVAAVGGTRFGHELLTRVAGDRRGRAGVGAALDRRRSADRRRPRPADTSSGTRWSARRCTTTCCPASTPGCTRGMPKRSRPSRTWSRWAGRRPRSPTTGTPRTTIPRRWWPRTAPRTTPGRRYRVSASRPACWTGSSSSGSRSRTRPTCSAPRPPRPAGGDGAGRDRGRRHMRALTLTRAALDDLDAEAEPLRAARLLVRRGKLLQQRRQERRVASESREAYRLLTRRRRPAPSGSPLMADVAYALAGDRRRASGPDRARGAERGRRDRRRVEPGVRRASPSARSAPAGCRSSEAPAGDARRAADRARATGDLPNLARALVNISDSLFELGRVRGVRGRRLARACRTPTGSASAARPGCSCSPTTPRR